MADKHSILIVDSNEGFASMLKESLEQDAGYRAAVATSVDEALGALDTAEFDLAIVDLGLENGDGGALAHSLREQRADLRLILIPLEGDQLPPELADLDVQGILPKPFFLPELPGHIADALARPIGGVPAAVEPETVAPVDSGPASDEPAGGSADLLAVVRQQAPAILQRMTRLAQDVNADVVIVACGDRLVSHTGRLSAEEANGLAQAVAESWRLSARMARILGRDQLRFEQSTEGGEHLLYSLSIVEDVILSVGLRANIPLGMIRHRAKETADALRTLIA